MTRIYLIRHAEAEGNLYRRIQGHYNSLVTERGRRQIEDLKKRFESTHIDAVYSSDLIRTQVTASAIFKPKNLPLITDPQLREVNMGVWEDTTWADAELNTPEQYYNFNNAPDKWQVEGSENVHDLQRRITDAILGIAAKHDGQTVAVFSHGSAIRTFLCGVLGISHDQAHKVPHCDNTAVALLNVENGLISPEYYGDNSHLSPDNSTFAHQNWWKDSTKYDSTNMRYVRLDMQQDAEKYLNCRRETWTTVHGSMDGFSEDCVAAAQKSEVWLGVIGDKTAGLVELDVSRGEAESVGYIEFCYMSPDYRRTGIGVQLIGKAVSVFRPLGRDTLRLRVEKANAAAVSFYEKYGFNTLSDEGGILTMEKDIKVRVVC